jgi:hypothetical protein
VAACQILMLYYSVKMGGVVRNRWSIRRYKCVVDAGYADVCIIL